jgi:hypothetical protein
MPGYIAIFGELKDPALVSYRSLQGYGLLKDKWVVISRLLAHALHPFPAKIPWPVLHGVVVTAVCSRVASCKLTYF